MKKFLLLYFLCLPSSFSENLVSEVSTTENEASVPKQISDIEIETRLRKVFKATGWFLDLEVEVDEGIVTFEGQFESLEKRNWAHNLTKKTDGVLAVIDKTQGTIQTNSFLKPAEREFIEMYRNSFKLLPYLVSAFIILLLFIFIAFGFKRFTHFFMMRRRANQLLVRSVANLVGLIVFIIGFYLSLKASGLSALAVTLLGGTGMLGLGIGLALKNIFENYASSIMISVKKLLRIGEVVSINGFEGVVQSVTTRGTTLMDYDGNNIIIPNTEVFNSTIKNFTRNPNMRATFIVGIGYEDSIDLAKKVISDELDKLRPEILDEPETIVAVDSLGSSTVNLKIYFWLNAKESSLIKMKSLAMKNIKEALMRAEISMPDDAREVVFASPLKVQNIDSKSDMVQKDERPRSVQIEINESKKSEDLSNEIESLKEQAKNSPEAESGENVV